MPEYIYHRPVPYQVDAAEILKEIGERPHMLLRISIRGGYFPHRNAPAVARIKSKRKTFHALYCETDDDESGFRAYFPTDVALNGILYIGFEHDVVAEFDLARLKLKPQELDAKKIETAFHRVTLKDLGVFKVRREAAAEER